MEPFKNKKRNEIRKETIHAIKTKRTGI